MKKAGPAEGAGTGTGSGAGASSLPGFFFFGWTCSSPLVGSASMALLCMDFSEDELISFVRSRRTAAL
jgi:hypothetical protein